VDGADGRGGNVSTVLGGEVCQVEIKPDRKDLGRAQGADSAIVVSRISRVQALGLAEGVAGAIGRA